MKYIIYVVLLLLPAIKSNSQIADNFSDGDFTTNPVWTGSPGSWIVNASGQLQSDNATANAVFYLSTPNTIATMAQWEFYIRLAFNPSSTNYVDVFLTANAADLSQNNTTGYFVRVGNTDDEISLYRKDASGSTKIIDGINGILNSSNNVMKIKVTRDAAGQWTLLRDLSGLGTGYSSEGTVVDLAYSASAFFGFLVKQSTAGFFRLHYFDDVEVKTYVPDIVPPQILSATATTLNSLDILFDEAVDAISAQQVNNYSASNGIGMPVVAIRDAGNNALVHVSFANNIPNGINCTININGVKDLSGNALLTAVAGFSYYTAKQYDVLIDELMADPSPTIGLPNYEYIELVNTSSFPVNLLGWKLADAGSSSGPMPNFLLKPDSFVIVCSSAAQSALTAFGPSIVVSSFPSLDNDGDIISLINASGKTIHAIHYDIDWYRNELKKEGGWSLEMIDTKNPCTGFNNWKASIDPHGGSPGKKNSVNGTNTDNAPPKLIRTFASDSLHIVLVFDEPLDSLEAVNTNHYAVSDGIGLSSTAVAIAPVFERIELLLLTPLVKNKVYTVTTNAVKDCAGNIIASGNKARAGLSTIADSTDIVINELLFNPKPDGVDYVELYNRSKKIVSLDGLYIANRNSQHVISNARQLSNEKYLLFPGEFMLLTEDPAIVSRQYLAKDPAALIQLTGMPSFNDDKGDAVLLNAQGSIIDELQYDEKWHFKLISDPEGVSLERISYEGVTQNPANWHSAATSAGYGTPGYKNSQYGADQQVKGEVAVSPEVFSPDNDGLDDFATINYEFPGPGYVANIIIFDAAGRKIRALQQNALCGIKGNFRWDGLGEKGEQLPVGIYIIYTAVFNLEGKTKRFKHVVVLARKKV